MFVDGWMYVSAISVQLGHSHARKWEPQGQARGTEKVAIFIVIKIINK
jgi:hypothetical protein